MQGKTFSFDINLFSQNQIEIEDVFARKCVDKPCDKEAARDQDFQHGAGARSQLGAIAHCNSSLSWAQARFDIITTA